MSVGPPGEPGGLFLYDEGDGEPAAGSSPVVSCERCTALARELTCSHTLNSSARASSLSVWGRWISQTLRETPLTPFPPPPPPDPCFTGVLFPRICFYLWRCLIAVQTGGKGFLSGMPIGFDETCHLVGK